MHSSSGVAAAFQRVVFSGWLWLVVVGKWRERFDLCTIAVGGKLCAVCSMSVLCVLMIVHDFGDHDSEDY